MVLEQEIEVFRQKLMALEERASQETQIIGSAHWSGLMEAGTVRRWRASQGAVVGPWAITIDGDDVTCADCVYMRGPVTLDAGAVAALTLTEAETAYVAAHIDLGYGTAELVEGASVAAVTDAAPQDADDVVKVLLYKLVKVGDAWGVTMDYRNMPQLAVRV